MKTEFYYKGSDFELVAKYLSGYKVDVYIPEQESWKEIPPYTLAPDIYRLSNKNYTFRIVITKDVNLTPPNDSMKADIDEMVDELRRNMPDHYNTTMTKFHYQLAYNMYIQGGIDSQETN
jgi:hypothetical protein